MAAAAAKSRLMTEYKGLQKEKWVHVELDEDALFKWQVDLMVVNPDSIFNGAYLKAEMTFSDEYPYSPPTFQFQQPIFHPNIYPDGKLCISILHAPGNDEQSGESASERWSPLQGVESVLRSILILLDDPEISSPANVDAGVMYRDNRAQYNKRAKEAVETSKQNIPEGVVMPTTLSEAPPVKFDDDDFWNESDGGDDFGASDSSDVEVEVDEDDEDGDGEQESEEDADEE